MFLAPVCKCQAPPQRVRWVSDQDPDQPFRWETGLRRDDQGNVIRGKIINKFTCRTTTLWVRR